MAQGAPSKKPLRLAEVVEKGVEGVFEFLARYLRTVAVVVWIRRDGVFMLLRDRRRSKPLYVMPLTYAAIGMFLLSLITQSAGTNPLDWIWSYEEISKTVFEKLTKEVSLIAIAIGAVPALMGLVALAALQAVAVGTTRPTARLTLFATCYAVGTQAFLLFVAALVLALGQFGGKSTFAESLPGIVGDGIGWVLIALLLGSVIAAVVVVPWFLLKALRLRRTWRAARWRGLGVFAVVLVSTLGGMWLYPLLADIPSHLGKIAKPSTNPVVSLVSDISVRWKDEELTVIADLQMTNPGTKPFAFRNRDIRSRLEAKLPVDGKLTKSTLGLELTTAVDLFGRRADFVWVRPNEVEWRRLTFHASVPDEAAYEALFDSAASPCLTIEILADGKTTATPCVHASLVKIP